MFWYIFRIKPLSRLVEKKIGLLEKEKVTLLKQLNQFREEAIREGATEYQLLKHPPENSFAYAFTDLSIKLWQLKIEIWKAVIGIK